MDYVRLQISSAFIIVMSVCSPSSIHCEESPESEFQVADVMKIEDDVPFNELLRETVYTGELIFNFTPPADAKLHAGKCDEHYEPILKHFHVNKPIEYKEKAKELVGKTYFKKVTCTIYTKTKKGGYDTKEATFRDSVIKGVVIRENGTPICKVGKANRDLPKCNSKIL